MADASQTHGREAEFHDAWAQATDVSSIGVDAAFEGPLALENRFILGLVGSLVGRRVLDIGAGLGESSVYFAKLGAIVTATDVSAGMMDIAQRLAHFHNVHIETVVGPVEELALPQEAFEVVYIANTIHHVKDRAAIFEKARGWLKKDGLFVSWDPVKYNPIINLYRRMAMGVRTIDEAPLGTEDLKLVRRYLPDARARCFWMAGLVIFLKYYLVDRIHPNADRYWKRIYRETDSTLWWWKPFRWADAVLTRIPGVRWLSWNVVIWAHRTE